jgi:putative oxidoreductase
MAITKRLLASAGPKSTILIRGVAGWVFLSEGVQKFLFPQSLGIGRFAKIGIPDPTFTAPFVGVVEIVFGALIIIGLMTRISTVPLLIDIAVAIATTKVPMLFDQGFWAAVHQARTDLSMLICLVFLLIVGAGSISLDATLVRQAPNR